jgi:peptidoglycan/xylan/chitin deacetylase (PgdA/CDA1 family)
MWTEDRSFIIPLVLHRIVRGRPYQWEDVTEDRLVEIVNVTGVRTTVVDFSKSTQCMRWLLTFDDGYDSNYKIVFPLLCSRKISAVFFLITDRIGEPGYLKWNQIKEMQRHGMCFGSHSRSHRDMSALSINDSYREFRESKAILEERLGVATDAFSYPYGAYSSQLNALGYKCGYTRLFSSRHGFYDPSKSFAPRNSVNSRTRIEDINSLLQRGHKLRLKWISEEIVKKSFKLMMGNYRYAKFRNGLMFKRGAP